MEYCLPAVEQEPATGNTETADLETEATDFEVEDPGLYDLARRLTDNALQGATSPSPNALATAPTGNGKHTSLPCPCSVLTKFCATLYC